MEGRSGMKAWKRVLESIIRKPNRADASVMYAYNVAQGLVHVLKACGDNLTRENVMKQAASIKDLELGGLLPGVKSTLGDRFAPISQLQLIRFKGDTWNASGEILICRHRRLARQGCLPKKQPLRPAAGLFVVSFRQDANHDARQKELC
jgi:hypothetical protein